VRRPLYSSNIDLENARIESFHTELSTMRAENAYFKVKSVTDISITLSLAVTVAAGVTTSWRGVWQITDAVLLPHRPLWSAVTSLFVGVVLFICCTAILPAIISLTERHKHAQKVLSLMDALFSYMCHWSAVLVWRGIWYLWDHAFGIGLLAAAEDSPLNAVLLTSGLISHGVGVMVLYSLGAMCCLSASPLLINNDRPPFYIHSLSIPQWQQYGCSFLLRSTRKVQTEPVSSTLAATSAVVDIASDASCKPQKLEITSHTSHGQK